MSARRKERAMPLPKGTRVTFTMIGLAASERDDLAHCTEDVYGIDDGGIVAFPHPNVKACVEKHDCPHEKKK